MEAAAGEHPSEKLADSGFQRLPGAGHAQVDICLLRLTEDSSTEQRPPGPAASPLPNPVMLLMGRTVAGLWPGAMRS